MKILILSIMVLNPYLFGINYAKWELKKEKNNIKVYLRDKDSFTKEYLAETIINSDLNSIYNVILDYDNAHKWMYKLESSKILKKESENLFYVYFTVNMNWPLKKRDLVSDVKVKKAKHNVVIELNSKPNYIKRNENYYRIEDTRSIWNLIKIDSKKTKVRLQSYAVIEGIPEFITNIFILESPIHSMSKLREKF